MIELLLESLMLIARWDVVIALLVGAIGGVIIGAIPGVGPAVAIAILLPATYRLEPLVGLRCCWVFTVRHFMAVLFRQF